MRRSAKLTAPGAGGPPAGVVACAARAVAHNSMALPSAAIRFRMTLILQIWYVGLALDILMLRPRVIGHRHRLVQADLDLLPGREHDLVASRRYGDAGADRGAHDDALQRPPAAAEHPSQDASGDRPAADLQGALLGVVPALHRERLSRDRVAVAVDCEAREAEPQLGSAGHAAAALRLRHRPVYDDPFGNLSLPDTQGRGRVQLHVVAGTRVRRGHLVIQRGDEHRLRWNRRRAPLARPSEYDRAGNAYRQRRRDRD